MAADAGYEGHERRSPESLLARELVVVKGQALGCEERLRGLRAWNPTMRRQLNRQLEISQERERQILATLGAKTGAGA